MNLTNLLDQIQVKSQQQISTLVEMFGMRLSLQESYKGFGEAYFSWVEPGAIKAWKQHLNDHESDCTQWNGSLYIL